MERDPGKVAELLSGERDDGPRQEEQMENPIQEVEWKKELTIQNIQTKKKMALELRQMGFGSDAIARILHLDELEREP